MSGEDIWDVVVVGAGIVGSCTAYTLAKKGLKVLLLEQVGMMIIKLQTICVKKTPMHL